MGSLSVKRIFAYNLITVIALGSLACIGSQVPRDLEKPTAHPDVPLTGEFVTSEGVVQKFEQFSDKPLVVMFSQLTCVVCKSEAMGLLLSLTNKTVEPAQSKFITVLVRSDSDEATEWKSKTKVPWTVGAIDSNEMLRPYCPDLLTPCTVIQFPGKKIVYSKSGEVTPQDMKRILGTLD